MLTVADVEFRTRYLTNAILLITNVLDWYSSLKVKQALDVDIDDRE